jgi:hypothetical protein
MIFNGYLLLAALLAALVPLALIATRQELRRVRLRLVEELRRTLFKHEPDLPQLELVAARYRATADETGRTRQGLVMIWTGASFFFAVSFVGFALLLVPRDWLLSIHAVFPKITYSLLWVLRPAAPVYGEALNDLALSVSVVGIAFLGGYIFQLRYLVRATINLELSALAFVRATLQIVQGMIVALVAYRVIYAVGIKAEGNFAGAAAATALGAAFIFGLFPNLGLMKIAKFVRVRAKTVDEDAMAAAKIVPLEVIDGIDAETAFRLEESNLFDVQNLASINPIALYAESPFSLHEILDWVLQAQLCTNVGARTFALLKQHKVRTIFDLERAVLARDAPPAYVRAIGAVFFDGATPAFRRAVGLPTDAPSDGGEIDPESVRHAVAIIVDDLHIHRLRALWRTMLRSTAGAEDTSPWLFETGPLPGDSGYSQSAGPAPRRPDIARPRLEPELVPDEAGPLPPPEPELAAPALPPEPELVADEAAGSPAAR